MDNFKRKFVEEALDLINELETVLMRIASNPEDKELIEHIFRIMHTLKGNSSMFGFNMIDQYTHQLETIYDLIRNGKMKVTDDLMDLTLSSVDHIRNLLDEENSKKEAVQATHKSLLGKIAMVIEGKNQPAEEKKPEAAPVDAGDTKTFYIHFQPNADILANGTNPLFLVEDFKPLGEYLALPNMEQLPGLEEMDPEKCYTSWELILSTKEDQEKIHEIFIFAEDSCNLEIEKVSDTNLLAQTDLVEKIKEATSGYKSIGLQRVKEIAFSEEKVEKKNQPFTSRGVEPTSTLKNISNIRVS